jgi:hypothetical protein
VGCVVVFDGSVDGVGRVEVVCNNKVGEQGVGAVTERAVGPPDPETSDCGAVAESAVVAALEA